MKDTQLGVKKLNFGAKQGDNSNLMPSRLSSYISRKLQSKRTTTTKVSNNSTFTENVLCSSHSLCTPFQQQLAEQRSGGVKLVRTNNATRDERGDERGLLSENSDSGMSCDQLRDWMKPLSEEGVLDNFPGNSDSV